MITARALNSWFHSNLESKMKMKKYWKIGMNRMEHRSQHTVMSIEPELNNVRIVSDVYLVIRFKFYLFVCAWDEYGHFVSLCGRVECVSTNPAVVRGSQSYDLLLCYNRLYQFYVYIYLSSHEHFIFAVFHFCSLFFRLLLLIWYVNVLVCSIVCTCIRLLSFFLERTTYVCDNQLCCCCMIYTGELAGRQAQSANIHTIHPIALDNNVNSNTTKNLIFWFARTESKFGVCLARMKWN